MTAERARYIIHRYSFGFPFAFAKQWKNFQNAEVIRCPNGITEAEDYYIEMIWSLLTDDKSYYDAVAAIAGGT